MGNIFVKHDTGSVIVLQLITLPELEITLGTLNSSDHVNKVMTVLQQSYDNYKALKDYFPTDEQFSVWEWICHGANDNSLTCISKSDL